jgi:hypothetical protein
VVEPDKLWKARSLGGGVLPTINAFAETYCI